MSDETNEKLDLISPTAEAVGQPEDKPVQVDPWAEAFGQLAKSDAEASGSDSADDKDAGAPPAGDPARDTVPADNLGAAVGDSSVDAGDTGGSLPDTGESGEPDGSYDLGDVEATITKFNQEIEERAISETAQLFLERADDQGRRLIRQTDGKLGASINDADIYRVDRATGTATFYNPDTGRPFTGDNPRAQAKAWVEAYNDELRDTFNKFTDERQQALQAEMAPVVELLKFTPTYDKLDSVRQQMLDALIEDYEVHDENGDHIGYSVDLNQALAQVNKQVAAIQASRNEPPKVPTGPAVDMPSSGSGNSGAGKNFSSIADAMEALQDAQLNKLNKR